MAQVKSHYSSDPSAMVLRAMIFSDEALSRISKKWLRRGMFANHLQNEIGKWCINYLHEYGHAPKEAIQRLFESWAEIPKNQKRIGEMEKVLLTVNDVHGNVEVGFVLKEAEQLFNLVKFSTLKTELESSILNKDVSECTRIVSELATVDFNPEKGITPCQEIGVLQEAFTDDEEVVLKYPGALGKLLGNDFHKGAFCAFLAPEKRGKSYWLLDVAMNAIYQRKKVAYFQAGDMSQKQLLKRYQQALTGRSIKTKEIAIPTGIRFQINEVLPDLDYMQLPLLTPEDIPDLMADFKWYHARSEVPLIKFSCHTDGELSTIDIESQLATWADEDNWLPDMVVIDFADILKMPNYANKRDAINETWTNLRGIALKHNVCLVTATQADAKSYDQELLRKSNFSDSKDKYGRVTSIYGINQTTEERGDFDTGTCIYRINVLMRRHAGYSETKVCYVAGNLDICTPHIISAFAT